MSARTIIDLAEDLNDGNEDYFDDMTIERICDSAYKMTDLCDDFLDFEGDCLCVEDNDYELECGCLLMFAVALILLVKLYTSDKPSKLAHEPPNATKSTRRENELRKCLRAKAKAITKHECEIQRLHELTSGLRQENERLVRESQTLNDDRGSLTSQLESYQRVIEVMGHENSKLRQQIKDQMTGPSRQVPDECSVCMEPFEADGGWRQPCMLKCKHIFCHECVTSWLEKSRNKVADCPVCRQQYKFDDLKAI